MKGNARSTRGTILDVPYHEKDQAKNLGAWWDPDLKKWFVPAGLDPEPFARWFQKRGEAAECQKAP